MKKTSEKTDTTAAGSIKNFKASSEVENFYRFIYENNLRQEAKVLMETVLKKIAPVKKRGRKKATLQ